MIDHGAEWALQIAAGTEDVDTFAKELSDGIAPLSGAFK